jgi:hypothetical protein
LLLVSDADFYPKVLDAFIGKTHLRYSTAHGDSNL